MVTGDIVTYAVALERLREISAHRHKQWEAINNTLEKLRLELARKQQAITCLGYRHVLEMLPNQVHLATLFPAVSLDAATPRWKLAWQVIVEKELYSMLLGFVNEIAPAGNVNCIAAPTIPNSAHPREQLRRLLENSFNNWKRRNKVRTSTAIGHNTFAVGLNIAPGVANTSSIKGVIVLPGVTVPKGVTVPEVRTNFTDLFININLIYWTWQEYSRGSGLYNELSNTIHAYGKQYEVVETNWAKSDFLALNYLTPTVASIKENEVDWNVARTDRELP